MITHPIKTAEGVLFLAKAATPGTKENALLTSIVAQAVSKVHNDFTDGDYNKRSRMIGQLVGQVVLAVIGTKGTTAATEALEASLKSGKLATMLGDIGRGTRTADEVVSTLKGAGEAGEKQLMLGSEWDDYFRSTYGSNNVSWDSKIKSVDEIFNNPASVKDITPNSLANLANRQGWEVGPLGHGGKAGIPFSEGGGMTIRKIGQGGDYIDKYIQYHPGGGHHGELPYFKVSSGNSGIQRFFLGGN